MAKTEEIVIRRESGNTSLVRRLGGELRSFTLGPYSMANPPRDRELGRLFGSGSSSAGVRVDEDSARSYAAVWNAVTLISGDIAKVPLPLYRRLSDGGKEQWREHYLYELVHDRPNPEMSSFMFRRTLTGHALLWGNGYAEIERDNAGRPMALWPLMPYAVQPFREGGRLLYRVTQPTGRDVVFDRGDVLHLSGFSPDGTTGYNPIRKAMESIGLGIATQRHAAKFYENGASMGTVVTYPQGLATTPQTRDENRKALEKRHQGVDNSHRMLVLYEGATVDDLGVNPEQAQLLDTRRFNVEEVARVWNCPVHKLKELARSTFGNIEHQSIEYVTDTLQPWFRAWESELCIKLVTHLERKQQFFEHIIEGLIRGDSAAQAQLITQQFHVGAITPNEIRAKFNYNPRPDGNDIQLPAQNMPADLHREYWSASVDLLKAQAEKAREPTPVPQPPHVAPKADDSEEVKSLREQVALARHATSLAEELRDKAAADLALAEAAKASLVSAHEQEVEELGDALREANTSLHVAASRQNVLTVDLESATQRCVDMANRADEHALAAAETRAQRDADKQAHAEALASIQKTLTEADLALAHTSEIAARLAARMAELEGALEAERAAHARTEQQRQEQAEAVEVSEGVVRSMKNGLDQWQLAHDKVAAQAADLQVALTAELDSRVTAEFQRGEAAKQATELQAMTREVAAQREALRVDLATVKQQSAGAEMALETERQQHRAQRAATLASMRSLFVDATERLLQKESDRARKHQTTPEKLRAWVDTFYPMHVETVRHAFRPIVSAWVVVTGGDAGEMVERLVSEHIEKSKLALMHVLDTDDEDLRAATLERTLRRWEEERADAMADALVREGMGQ
jgi:HK97 family phage portal protein